MALTHIKDENYENFKRLIDNIDNLDAIDKNGENIIHHMANLSFYVDESVTIFNNIALLIDRGCEIDHKNNEGKTPLHLAAKAQNSDMIKILLHLGADMNIIDDNKKVPYAYVSDKYCREEFAEYVLKLKAVDFFTNELDDISNSRTSECGLMSYETYAIISSIQPEEQEKEKYDLQLKKNISKMLSTSYVFSDKFVKNYRRIPVSQREKIYNLCLPFKSLINLLKIQLRRVNTKNRLLKPAADSFQALTEFSVPEMCLGIVDCLSNDDLMNLVRAVNGTLEYLPQVQSEEDLLLKLKLDS